KNEILFFSVWRNKVILNEIQRHHRLYNENKKIYIDKSMDQLRYHPHRRYATKIIINVNEPLEPHGQLIPYGTTKLKFYSSFNKPIQAGDIPTTVTSLQFSNTDIGFCNVYYSHRFDIKSVIPPSVTELSLGINQEISPNTLPPSLTSLTMELDQDILIGTFPQSLTALKQNNFNRTITPGSFGSIVDLSLESFNQPLKAGDLPITCKYLYLGSYNQPLQPNILPPELKELELINFKHPLSHEISIQTFPHSIETLFFNSFNQVIKPNVLPPSITNLFLNKYNHPPSDGTIPNSVTYLTLPKLSSPLQVGVLPESLTKLTFKNGFDQPIDPATIPQSVTQISL
ncbi:hypothetical protein DICPUDRAFT_18109, partial [Dictyostelium purpureum]